MSTLLRLVPLALLALAPFAACTPLPGEGEDGGTSSNGSDGGSGEGGRSLETAGEQCTRFMTAYCTRSMDDCGLATSSSKGRCISEGVPQCCQEGCSKPALSTSESVDTCIAALKVMSCRDAQATTLPASCQGVVEAAP